MASVNTFFLWCEVVRSTTLCPQTSSYGSIYVQHASFCSLWHNKYYMIVQYTGLYELVTKSSRCLPGDYSTSVQQQWERSDHAHTH